MVKSINKPRQSHQPAPKPVHPTSIRHHGLFGPGFIEFSQLEDRIAYQSEYALHEELAIRTLHREIKNSSTRLKAIKILNTTYKQLLATLKGDEKFLEPILNSLTKDIEDQQNFIAYVLYMGTPAMSKVMELRHTIAKMEDVNRKQRNTKNLWASEARRNSWQTKKYSKDTNVVINLGKHYARETRDMTLLRRVLNDVEGRVKKLQQGTLSWKPEAIPSVLKQQTTNNESLKKQISLNSMHMELLSHRNTNLYYQQQFRNMDFGGKFLKNKEHIQKLEQQILKEELKKNETIKWIHERAKVSVVISCSLWNFFDILRHVPVRREPKTKSLKYPKEYLKLPLLRFENMEMKVSPPLEFEGDVLTVLRIVNQKLKKLMGAYDQLISEKSKKDSESSDVVVETTEEYCALYLQSAKSEDFTADLMSSKSADQSNDPSPKDNVKIPSRGFLKDLSIKIVEKNLTKEE
ncbi:uncharacterized protein LOC142238391 isoform X2 [Haematobia irritans]|uniref:uncharacterized protein LOC142238391 isoform X2 n=1 Tax=Haematobia irritans TaxID=7368 RepID=UPI003F4F53F8